jgi:adenylate cyclase
VKVGVPVVVAGAVMGVCGGLFRGSVIEWLSPVKPLVALLAASPLAFGYTYFAEDRQRRFMLRALSKVVSPAVAEELAANPGRLALGTVRTEITILFTDVAGFTDLAEGMDVQDLGKFINRYLGEMSTRVFEQDGTLDKYIGDAVMAFWNAPVLQKDHAVRACRAALAMVARERALQGEFGEIIKGEGRKGEGGERDGGEAHRPDADATVFTRIGIHTAHAAVGFIGSEHLFNYTAMGDGVNLASRMEGANKIYGTQILITEATAVLVREEILVRKVDVLRVKGKKVPMAVYEVMGERGGDGRPRAGLQTENATARIQLYEEALAAYQGREWERAEKLLLEVSERFGQDGPSEVLRERIAEFRQNPPPAEWDGVHVSKTK